MDTIVLLLFAACILIVTVIGASILYALTAGFLLFAAFALYKGITPKEIIKISLDGIRKIRSILLLFLLIGILTAVWRSSATIPTIISYTANLLHPKIIILMCFLLNSVLSFLTGTSFGTVATMGVLTMGVANAAGIHPLFSGGAILSGVFFGDRCSPVSTSAMLVAEITDTNLYRNLRNMFRSAALPFALTAGLYYLIGLSYSQASFQSTELTALFASCYRISWVNLLPAFLILICAAFRLNVKCTLLISIVCGCLLSFFMQHVPFGTLLKSIIEGYRAPDPQLATLFNGGGILSMLRVMLIITISATYSGLFSVTNLLGGLSQRIANVANQTTDFIGTLIAAALSALISCNQSLASMLTEQLCRPFRKDADAFALDLEDSVILLAPLVPWSIAGAVPIATIAAPTACLFFAFYLYLVPLCALGRSLVQKLRKKEI